MMKLVYQQFLINNGKVPSDTEFDSLNGPPLRMVAALLKQKHAIEAELDTLLSEYQVLVDKAYESVCPNPGAEELLAGARRRNFTTAIVTSNSHLRTERCLRKQV
ncbi:MAG: HAD hydrolase-like protein [Candidatus Obscuribacter sp.]|nr:HAD hydrolase-like protein [Candidatus Obscuribacter sp.]